MGTMPNSTMSHIANAVQADITPKPLPRMQSFAQYKQGKSKIPGHEDVMKLSSNEGCFGPHHGLDPDRIVCGNGSEEVIGLLIRCYLGENDELLLPENHFVMCSIYGKGQGARIVLAPEKDFTVDVDTILDRINSKTRIISIANPNNPTGTYLPASEIERLVDNVPERIMIILDGAYAEYVDRRDYDAGAGWVDSRSNVVMTRTFSKIYGLAGLRIGWGYGPAGIIEVVNRLRTPFNASGPALAAATAALTDQAHVDRSREHVARWQEQISEALGKLGLHAVPSVANFYLLDFGGLPGKSAADAGAFLEKDGIIPRPGGSDAYLRITVGTDDENRAVIDSLTRYLTS
jgi:histidinol-phosphate aminotransferase